MNLMEEKRHKTKKGNKGPYPDRPQNHSSRNFSDIYLSEWLWLPLDGAGYHWIYAFIMSLLISAGAGQFLTVALLAAGAGLTEFIIATLAPEPQARHITGCLCWKNFPA
jgi:hypothetical protein